MIVHIMINNMTIKDILSKKEIGQHITVYGWVRSMRDSKNHAFLAINDGSCLANLQVFFDKTMLDVAMLQEVQTGASVQVHGQIVASQGQEQPLELQAMQVSVLGACATDYPLQKKRHTLEFIREMPHLRTRTNTIGAMMRVRSKVSMAIHQFFDQRQFHYMHTPIITASDCEGAGEMFQVTHLSEQEMGANTDYNKDFFGKKAGLTVSGQLAVETACMSLGRVYTFGPTFRAENSNTVRHLAEFWMVEPEMAFCDLDGDMALATDFVQYLLKYALDECAEDLAFFNQHIQPGLLDTLQQVATAQFEVMTYTQAIQLLEKSNKSFQFPFGWGLDLKSEHERYLTEEIVKRPTIVIDYPKDIKSFYMKLGSDGKTVRCMDILVPGVGEIIGGSQREDDYATLLQRMQELKMNADDYQWYLDLRRYGSVPHSGFGLGLERMLMYMTGMSNMRDTILYPRARNLCIG
jgi:asparaginyl-tRNA synthetase